MDSTVRKDMLNLSIGAYDVPLFLHTDLDSDRVTGQLLGGTMIRLIELIGGLAAGVIGLLIAALLFFVLPYSVGTTTSNGTSTTTILPGATLTLIVVALLGVLAIGVAIGAFLHVQRHMKAGRLLLLISTGLFLLGMLLGRPKFWIGYAVVLLLALISASMALISVQRVTLT